MQFRSLQSAKDRRQAVEQALQVQLPHISHFSFDESSVENRNIENLLGATQIPLGIAGPLLIKNHAHFIPLATTEGALVASVNRGCKAVTEAGGVNTYAHRVGMTRGPVFYTGSLEGNKKLYSWLKEHEKDIAKVAEHTSSHLTFKKMMIKGVADYTFVRFSFDTQDAMGMNMVTIASEAIANYIEEKTGFGCVSVAGNFDVDKKPSFLNFINNRGFKAWAEVIVSQKIVEETLKTTPQKIFDVWYAKCMLGSALSGSLGFNAHYANIIAAIFLATGQDAAHVVEGSMGVTTVRVTEDGDLYFSVYLPALCVGTVGGGTSLPTQKESLSILGIKGEGQTEKFAEIIAGAVLAGELSLLASLSEGSLGKAHERFGRGKKT